MRQDESTSNPEEKMSFRVIFVGDSLMNPRYPIGLRPEDTYSYSLEMFWRKYYSTAYARTLLLPGRRLKEFSGAFYDYFLPNEGGAKVDVSVIHLGIIDCAPRVLSPMMYFVIERLPKFLQKRIQSFLHNNRPRLQKAGWSFRFTSPKEFEDYYSRILRSLATQSLRVYAITIVPGRESVYLHSPGLKESIILYNEIIRKLASEFENVKLIDVFKEFQSKPDLYLTDDLHITKDGHSYIYQCVRDMELAVLQG
jgi:acyl-CoA thioesterase-1